MNIQKLQMQKKIQDLRMFILTLEIQLLFYSQTFLPNLIIVEINDYSENTVTSRKAATENSINIDMSTLNSNEVSKVILKGNYTDLFGQQQMVSTLLYITDKQYYNEKSSR